MCVARQHEVTLLWRLRRSGRRGVLAQRQTPPTKNTTSPFRVSHAPPGRGLKLKPVSVHHSKNSPRANGSQYCCCCSVTSTHIFGAVEKSSCHMSCLAVLFFEFCDIASSTQACKRRRATLRAPLKTQYTGRLPMDCMYQGKRRSVYGRYEYLPSQAQGLTQAQCVSAGPQ